MRRLFVTVAVAASLATTALGASSGSGSFAPDPFAARHAPANGRIAFASTLPSWPPPANLGAARVYRVAITGGKPVMLDQATTGGGDGAPLLSPDGSEVALVRVAADTQQLSLWSMSTDGSGERRLFTPGPPQFQRAYSFAPLDWSPDGSRLALRLTTACAPELDPHQPGRTCLLDFVLIVDLQGRLLATVPGYIGASWAPGGERLVLESNLLLGPQPEDATIDIIRADGTKLRSVSGAVARSPKRRVCFEYPSWSADGRFVAFEETSCDSSDEVPALLGVFHLVRASDGRLVRSVKGSFAGWAPTAARFAYLGPGKASALFVSGASGTGRRLAAKAGGGFAVWAPAGDRLYFFGKGKGQPLVRVGADGHGLELLLARSVKWCEWASLCLLPAPDGRRLALLGATQLAVLPEQGGSPRVLARFPARALLWPLGWSHDGHALFYSISLPVLERSALWTIAPDGTAARMLPTGAAAASEPSWSPDGARIAFTLAPSKGSRGGIAVVRADARGAAKLIAPGDGSAPAWSRDGALIAYDCAGDALCVVRPDGSRQHRVITPPHDPAVGEVYFRNPSWSPDSQSIIYARADPRTGASIRLVRPDGTGDHVLLAADNERSGFNRAVFSPDGARIALEGYDCGSGSDCRTGIYLANADGTAVRFVTGSERGVKPTWAPDGRTLAFSATASSNPQLHQLYTIDVDGGTAKPLTTFAADTLDPAWSPPP